VIIRVIRTVLFDIRTSLFVTRFNMLVVAVKYFSGQLESRKF